MPTTNDILSGLAFAIGLTNKIRDPNKEQRQRLLELLQTRPDLIQQYKDQGNPDIAKTLAGLKPRFGPSGSYDKLTSLINNAQASPETQRNQYLRDILKDPNNPDAIEYKQTGRIRTADEKKADALALKTRQEEAEEGAARLQIAQQQAKEKQEDIERTNAYRKVAIPTIARISKEGMNNLYEAIVTGKVSGDESTALWGTPEVEKRLQNDRLIYQDREQQKASGQQRAIMRTNDAINNLIEDARNKGQVMLSFNDASALINNPDLANTNPRLKAIVTEYKTNVRKATLPAAKSSFLRETDPIRKDLVGREPKPEDIEALNNASATAFAGTTFAPLVFGLRKITVPGRLYGTNNKDVVSIIGGDPELIKDYKNLYPVQTENQNQPVDKAAAAESLHKKYPNETPAQIKARVERGEK